MFALYSSFLEIGVQILNPIHVRAAGMDPFELKKDYGDKIVFWGGGVDTQGILPMGTPHQVRDDVKRNLEALIPGGGYIFNTIHDIQADVPPENLVAMIETLHTYGVY
jgi:uroporphyrinogen decarboxylase